MKKILGFLLIVVLVFSLAPLVFADNGSEDVPQRIRQGKDDVKERLGAVKDGLRERIRESQIFQKVWSFQQMRQKEAFSKFRFDGFKARKVSGERLKQARDNFNDAKERLKLAKDSYKDNRQKFLYARNDLRQCNDEVSEECDSLRLQVREHSKDFLLDAADMVLSELQKVESKLEESEDLTDEEVSEELSLVQQQILDVAEAKAVLESLDDNSSKEEFQEAADTILSVWKDSKPVLQRASGKVVNARIGGILMKTSELEARLEKVLVKAGDSGLDVSGVDTSIFSEKLDSARQSYELAVDAWQENNADVAKQHMDDAHQFLKDAHDELKDIFSSLKYLQLDDDLEQEVIDDNESLESSE